MTSRLEGKTAVITGGTSGIGEATAERFVGEGARVVLAGRSEEKGAALAKRLGDSALYCRCDVTVESDLAGAIGLALERWGKLDILFKGIGHTSWVLAQRPSMGVMLNP